MTRQTYILHGSSPNWTRDLQSMRHYVPEQALRSYLAQREDRFVEPDACAEGDVLTVDDSTRAGFETCLIARELGHEITLFVNPSQIISGNDYWFSRFDALVDGRTVNSCMFQGVAYDLDSREQLRKFRFAVRPLLLTARETAAHRLLDEVERLLGAEDAKIGEHARTMTRSQFDELCRAGVRIGNHGWDHQCISALDPQQQREQLIAAGDWLRAASGQPVVDYAVPFGLERLHAEARPACTGTVYLVDPGLPPEAAGEGNLFRSNLTPMLQESAA
ncbi:polysaccharide deacetylase family protein [Sphingomonas sp. DG1-23]|uniref:polysaccharide deacetylase family protein n=1 Tax=Sphingomonas sp. DG1-23 TaxID=3068316 RepID=UPI00273D8AC2|nr:polysaccharide deacetylase family protein [Sphingomonas sp. DG1-23]MDP5278760.1 polysaccharide deacetylase family protein [Sphingomonas sp. DG1-23]